MQEQVFARIDGGAEEVHTDTRYHWDNSKRKESNRINLQRTIGGEAFWEDESGRQRVPVGHAMLFTQRENSRYGYPAIGQQPYRHRYLSIDPTSTAIPLFNRIRQDFGSVVNMPNGSESARLFDEAYHLFRSHSFRDRYHETEIIVRLFLAIYRQQIDDTLDQDPIEYGYHLISNNFQKPQALKEIAQQCGVSREHFIRSFQLRYQTTPGAYLKDLRLRHARSLLETTEFPIAEVALASGFASSNTFCRAFRQHYQCSPGQLRTPHLANPAPRRD